jgi:hypothetical protein
MIAIVIFAAPLFTQGLAPVEIGAGAPSAAACTKCHSRVAHEWSASRHGQAWVNAIFQREYRDKPNEWCVHCHAPLAPQLAEVRAGGGRLADEGVNCAVCHVRDGHVVAARRRAGSPHDTVEEAGFGGPSFCAGCHQFNFPRYDESDRVIGYGDEPMQATVAQHAAGALADVGCRACHAASPAKHGYPGGHDASMLARAIAVSVCRDGDAAVIAVRNRGAGHAVPTGDVHRHLAVRAWRATAPERLAEGFIGRRFTVGDDGEKRTTFDNSIVPGDTRRFRFALGELGGEAGEAVSFEVRYVYTIDEFPTAARALAEPTWASLFAERVRPEELAPCAPVR